MEVETDCDKEYVLHLPLNTEREIGGVSWLTSRKFCVAEES